MKRRFAITLPAIALISLSACGDLSGGDNRTDDAQVFAPDTADGETAASPQADNRANSQGSNKPKDRSMALRPGWREVECLVRTFGETYEGPCAFRSQEGGTFTIERENNAPMGGATSITVAVIAPGEADVRGLTRDGVNSRWGSAQRSETDRACWVGSDFTICAY